MMSEERGAAVGAMRSSTSCGMVMRSSASLASSPSSMVTAVQRRPVSARAIADRDRDFDGGLEAAPHIELLGLAADEYRHRLERELGIARRGCRFGALG